MSFEDFTALCKLNGVSFTLEYCEASDLWELEAFEFGTLNSYFVKKSKNVADAFARIVEQMRRSNLAYDLPEEAA